MKILYILQQSIYNNDNKWSTADSNIQMFVGIIRELTKKTDWEFYILIGKIDDFFDIKSYDEIFKHDRVHFIPYNFPIDAFLNRQHFNVFDFEKIYEELPQIDIIWNNITEITRNIKTFLYMKKSDAKIISCCFWLDCPEIHEPKVNKDISYQWRQFDGMECSDLCVFTCKSTKKAFIENSKRVFKNQFISSIKNKSVIWDFGFSMYEFDNIFNDNSFKNDEKITILFLNRLSNIGYTKHNEFILAVNELSKTRNDFNVVFTNPSQKVTNEWLKNNVSNIKLLDGLLNKQDYIKLLQNSNISVHLYNIERYGGVAFRESVYCNNIVITPKIFEYANILGNKYEFYVKNDLSNLKEIISLALDKKSYKLNKSIYNRNKKSSFEFISDGVINDINSILENK
jgi:hypothetical protein